MLVSFFSRQMFTLRSVSREYSPIDHALVDARARRDEQHAALLQVEDGVRRAPTPSRSATMAPLVRAWIVAVPRRPAVEQRVHDAGAARVGEEARAEADQAARRDGELQPHAARAGVDHLGHLAAAHGEQLRDDADVVLRNVDHQQLDRLVQDAVDRRG